jgi:hypothetical protein
MEIEFLWVGTFGGLAKLEKENGHSTTLNRDFPIMA